jgi:hypothetical protein
MRKIVKFSISLILTGWAACSGAVYFPHLYQSTIYTDNLLMTGGWWANPALISSIKSPYAHTANVLPLCDSLLISSFRFFMPVGNIFTAGIGILGAGAYKTGTSVTSFDNKGATFSSSFAFNQPRCQLGGAILIPRVGSVGVMGTIGYEEFSYTTYSKGVASPGAGFGWLSPSIGKSVTLSFATMFIYHNHETPFWEKSCKAGAKFYALDSLLSGCLEYTFTPGRGFGVIAPEPSRYESYKAILAARVFEMLSVSGGFSNDYSRDRYSNGPCAHAGLELLKMAGFPFSGGYEIGFRPGWDWAVLHHIWLGLDFVDLKEKQRH